MLNIKCRRFCFIDLFYALRKDIKGHTFDWKYKNMIKKHLDIQYRFLSELYNYSTFVEFKSIWKIITPIIKISTTSKRNKNSSILWMIPSISLYISIWPIKRLLILKNIWRTKLKISWMNARPRSISNGGKIS